MTLWLLAVQRHSCWTGKYGEVSAELSAKKHPPRWISSIVGTLLRKLQLEEMSCREGCGLATTCKRIGSVVSLTGEGNGASAMCLGNYCLSGGQVVRQLDCRRWEEDSCS